MLLATATGASEGPGSGETAARPAELFAQGMAGAAAGDLEGALDRLEAAVAAVPDNLRWGAEYRQVVIRAGEHDRGLGFFEGLLEAHPESSNLVLNYAYAHVDKIPAAGAITQVILANQALTQFGRALELRESWLARYTRGNSYVYWPRIFGRTPLGIADLERAIEMARAMEKRSYHAFAWAALGDGYWRLGELGKAREVWQEGLARHPADARLQARLSRTAEELDAFLEELLSPATRVGTDLRELWEAGWQGACDCDPELGR